MDHRRRLREIHSRRRATTPPRLSSIKIKQYAYFAIGSDVLTPDEIARRVGLPPDRALLRGSRIENPPRPAIHKWEIRCDEPGLPVNEMIARVLARLEPSRSAIRDSTPTMARTR
jgi:hypothetical protein